MHGEVGETGRAVGNVCCVHRAVKGGELSHQKTDPARRPGIGFCAWGPVWLEGQVISQREKI